MSMRCQRLLLQIYLHFPEVIQHVTLPAGTFSSGGAADGSSCKVKMPHHLLRVNSHRMLSWVPVSSPERPSPRFRAPRKCLGLSSCSYLITCGNAADLDEN